jgi:hypothetical protein
MRAAGWMLTSIFMRPALWPPMVISKNTTGFPFASPGIEPTPDIALPHQMSWAEAQCVHGQRRGGWPSRCVAAPLERRRPRSVQGVTEPVFLFRHDTVCMTTAQG